MSVKTFGKQKHSEMFENRDFIKEFKVSWNSFYHPTKYQSVVTVV